MEFVALISGGKDSLYSLLHCVQNGYKLVALANLHPPTEDNEEMDSFMYQTVGHNVIPLYSEILNVPLYRAAIKGKSLNTDLAYHPHEWAGGGHSDETEDLYGLLETVRDRHPGVKAVTSGAILSTYQRTRVESVCGRLGLTSLSWLWQRSQGLLLAEMAEAGLDARIIKVASGGLDERLLGKNVTDTATRNKLEQVRQQWGGNVAGEGGEFETLVFGCKGWRARVEAVNTKVISGEGGVSWLQISESKLVPTCADQPGAIKKPSLLEKGFRDILSSYETKQQSSGGIVGGSISVAPQSKWAGLPLSVTKANQAFRGTYYFGNITSDSISEREISSSEELRNILSKLHVILKEIQATPRNITSSLLLIRSMSSFLSINDVYKSFFSSFPNPPSRVCVAIGDTMPPNINVMLSVVVDLTNSGEQNHLPGTRQALHVQSRSYWAPANVGPYSQAISVDGLVSVAGMIGLVPETMKIWAEHGATGEAILALQSMVRVGREMGVHGKTGWAGAVAYVRDPQDAAAAEYAWETWFRSQAALEANRDVDDHDEAPDVNTSKPFKEFERGDSDIKEAPITLEAKTQFDLPPLVVVQVDDLPISARVEYAPLGIDGAYLQQLLQLAEDDDSDQYVRLIGKGNNGKVDRNNIISESSAMYTVTFGRHILSWGVLKTDNPIDSSMIASDIASALSALFVKDGWDIVGMTLFVPPSRGEIIDQLVEALENSSGSGKGGIIIVPVKGVFLRATGGSGSWSNSAIGVSARLHGGI